MKKVNEVKRKKTSEKQNKFIPLLNKEFETDLKSFQKQELADKKFIKTLNKTEMKKLSDFFKKEVGVSEFKR